MDVPIGRLLYQNNIVIFNCSFLNNVLTKSPETSSNIIYILCQ